MRETEASGTRVPVVFLDHTGTPGGGQLEMLRLLPQLERIAPRAVFATGGITADQLSAAGVDVLTLDKARVFRAWKAPYYARLMDRALQRIPRDTPIVAVSSAAAQILAFLPRGRRRRVFRLNEDFERFKGRGWKSLLYFGWIFRRYDGFLANSHWTASTVPRSLSRVPLRSAHSLSGITGPVYRPTPVFADSDVRVACFSRSARWKGLDLAVDAVTRVAARGYPISLRLYGGEWQGNAGYGAELRRLAEESPANITFEGHVDDVLEVMTTVDVVIMPSRLPEPFGQVTVQSLAAGCLTIVSDHGGSLELVQDMRTGRTFRNEDAGDLARVLTWVLEDRTAAAAIARDGALTASRMKDSTLARRMEDAILDLVGDGSDTTRGSRSSPARRTR